MDKLLLLLQAEPEMKAEAQPEVKPEQDGESVEVGEPSIDQTPENKEVTH